MVVRLLSNPGLQRWSAIALAILGLACLEPMARMLIAGASNPHAPKLSDAAQRMQLASDWMIALTVLVGSCLALYLAVRGHRRSLSRLLAVSCATLASGFGLFYAVRALIIVHPSPEVWLTRSSLLALAATFVIAVVLMSMWMYSTANFLLQFPKAVKLMGQNLEDVGSAVRIRRGSFDLRWFLSPQFAALAAGGLLIFVMNHAYRLDSVSFDFFSMYFVCWFPFAVIGAKLKQLDEEGRRAVRWVLLGQTVWLVFFLGAMLVLAVLGLAGVLGFANWTDTSAFLHGFFSFFYAGFAIVLMATLAFSILYNGTLDPDLMLRRTWVLAGVGLSSGVMFVLIERLIANLVADWLGLSAVDALTIVAAVTAAVVYPMRSWLEARVRWAMEGWQAAHVIADGVRRDAVIVFADLSGYTALTERNEREALIMAAIFHRDAQQAARDHRGVLVKTIGDAVLLRFDDAESAVVATQGLERAFRAHVHAMALEPLPIHAAVHRGEVVQSPSGDVFGSTVNLAARLLGAAGPGDIVASRAAIESSPIAARSHSLGERKFKNVELPVECFKVA
jgi:adenylate cyclase